MKTTRLTTTTIALTGLLLLGACGGDDDKSSPEASDDLGLVQPDVADGDAADVPDPCTLLTEDQAGAVIGSPVQVGGPHVTSGGFGTDCTFTGPKAGTLQLSKQIVVHTDIDRDVRLGEATQVSGLDEPHLDETLHNLSWYPDGLQVDVQIISNGERDGTDSRANLETLAVQVDEALG
jgi:hypothetical protein